VSHRRRAVFIEPHFQTRFVLRLAGWVAFATLLTGLVTYGVLTYEDRLAMGDLMYISPEGGPAPHPMTRLSLIVPSVALSLVLNLTLIVLFAVFYSRRLAGPILKLRLAFQQWAKGESIKTPFRLRKHDEFHLLAADFEELLQKKHRPSS
jgi:HAMP domain-containing protein